MTKVQFTNSPLGTEFVFAVNSCVYQIRERLGRKLVMQRVTPCASASLVEIVADSQRSEWKLTDAEREFRAAFTPNRHGEYA